MLAYNRSLGARGRTHATPLALGLDDLHGTLIVFDDGVVGTHGDAHLTSFAQFRIPFWDVGSRAIDFDGLV